MSAPRRPPRRQVDGVLLLDKPSGISSNARAGARQAAVQRREGGPHRHARSARFGAAADLLRRGDQVRAVPARCPKRYSATLRFGVTTTTQDAEGEVVAVAAGGRSTATALDALLAAILGPTDADAARAFGAEARRASRTTTTRAQGIDIPRVARDVSDPSRSSSSHGSRPTRRSTSNAARARTSARSRRTSARRSAAARILRRCAARRPAASARRCGDARGARGDRRDGARRSCCARRRAGRAPAGACASTPDAGRRFRQGQRVAAEALREDRWRVFDGGARCSAWPTCARRRSRTRGAS